MDLTERLQKERDRLDVRCLRAAVACEWMWRTIVELTDQAQREKLKPKLAYLLRQELGENDRFTEFLKSWRVPPDDKFIEMMLGDL